VVCRCHVRCCGAGSASLRRGQRNRSRACLDQKLLRTSAVGALVTKELLIGIQESGVMNTDYNEFDTDTKFRLVKEAGVFDYFDKTPTPADGPIFNRVANKCGVPLTAGGWFYMLGRDEPLLQWHLQMAKEYDTRVQNVQIFT